VCALFSALAASFALVVAVPAGATAAPAAVEEYDLALPQDEGPQDPAPAPEAAEPVAPAAPAVPLAPTEEALPVAPPVVQAPPEPERELDRAAARRDVLFEAPIESAGRESLTVAAPVGDSSLPPVLWLLVALGGACIVATLVRLRRFAAGLGASPRVLPRSQTSS
jgi:hypothetical protein